MFGPLEESTYEDYDWMMGVNFGGVVNGIQHVRAAHDRSTAQGGYIVNTASMSGLIASGPAGIYSASKFAVVGLSQALRQSLDRYDIGVSVLCPGNVNTNIAESVLTRPAHLSNSGYHFDADVMTAFRNIYSAGMDPVDLAEHTLAAMSRNQLYVIPYPEMRQRLVDHFESILAVLSAARLGSRRRHEAPGRDDALRARTAGDRSPPQVARAIATPAGALQLTLMSLIWMTGCTLE